MSDTTLVALFASIPPTIVAFAGLVQTMRNAQIGRENSRKLDEGHEKLEEVRKLTNGLNDKIAESAKAAGYAEGVAQGKAEQQERDK